MRITVYCLFFCLILACSSSNEEQARANALVLSRTEDKLDVFKAFKDIDIVEFKNGPLIGVIKSVLYYDQYFYLLDAAQSDIKIYDKNFVYVRTVNHAGIGPGQYRKLSGAFVNERGLFIFSDLDMAIFRYSIYGEFIEKIVLSDYPFDILPLDDRLIAYTNFNPALNDKYNLLSLSLDGSIRDKTQPYSVVLNSLIGYSGGIYHHLDNSSEFLFNPPWSDSVFVYDQDLKLKNLYIIDDLIKNKFDEGIYSGNFHNGLRNQYGHISSFSSKFDGLSWFTYKEPPYLKTGLMDWENSRYYEYEDIMEPQYLYFLSDLLTQDDNGYYYSKLSSFVPKDSEIVHSFANKIGFSSDKMGTEDFNFLVRYKVNK